MPSTGLESDYHRAQCGSASTLFNFGKTRDDEDTVEGAKKKEEEEESDDALDEDERRQLHYLREQIHARRLLNYEAERKKDPDVRACISNEEEVSSSFSALLQTFDARPDFPSYFFSGGLQSLFRKRRDELRVLSSIHDLDDSTYNERRSDVGVEADAPIEVEPFRGSVSDERLVRDSLNALIGLPSHTFPESLFSATSTTARRTLISDPIFRRESWVCSSVSAASSPSSSSPFPPSSDLSLYSMLQGIYEDACVLIRLETIATKNCVESRNVTRRAFADALLSFLMAHRQHVLSSVCGRRHHPHRLPQPRRGTVGARLDIKINTNDSKEIINNSIDDNVILSEAECQRFFAEFDDISALQHTSTKRDQPQCSLVLLDILTLKLRYLLLG